MECLPVVEQAPRPVADCTPAPSLASPRSSAASTAASDGEDTCRGGDEQGSSEPPSPGPASPAVDEVAEGASWDAPGALVDVRWASGGCWRVGLVYGIHWQPQDCVECCCIFFTGRGGEGKWKLVPRGEATAMAPFGKQSGQDLPPLFCPMPSTSRPGGWSFLDTVTGVKYATQAVAWEAHLRRAMAATAPPPGCAPGTVVSAADGAACVEQSAPPGGAAAGFEARLHQPSGAGVVTGGLFVEELSLGPGRLDLMQPPVVQQLREKLGCSPGSCMEAHVAGGQNHGIWFLGDFALKLVRSARKFPLLPSEVENVVRLQAQYPSIVDDPSLTFPVKVFNCVGHAGSEPLSLLAMRRARGQELANLVAMWPFGQREQVGRVFEDVGRALRAVHSRYGGAQHGDLHPSNIFFDAEAAARGDGAISFIDVGGMGMLTGESDEQHFAASLQIYAGFYGPDFAVEGFRRFQAGYYPEAAGRNG